MTSNGNAGPWSDPVALARTLTAVAEKSQRLINDFLQHQVSSGALGLAEMTRISQTFLTMLQHVMANPAPLALAQFELWQDYMALWQRNAAAWFGQPATTPAVSPDSSDRRFRHPDWQYNLIFDFIKQSYLLTARWLQSTVGRLEGLDDRTRRRLDFYTRQFVDALAPTNFPLTNPEVLRATLESGGENLLKGLENLLTDLERGRGFVTVRQTDLAAFAAGRDVATTPGDVIFQNDLMQLIQYRPSTETVFCRPLLIVPPWINKYYVLDLREQNSFVRWWVAQGFTVFMISWHNPDERLAGKEFEDYLRDGPLAALDAIEQVTGEHQVNTVGYCLGGTLLACTLAYLAAIRDPRVSACTLLATMLDFEQPGELEVFIDEEELSMLEQYVDQHGHLDGLEMTTTFNLLRANDLIWSFFVNNYLLGQEPFPFDLLYWNADATRLPARMHSFYLRNMYQNDLLKEPGGITLLGKAIDLDRVTAPIYAVATIDDHIAPWPSVYASSRLFGGAIRFVLGGSGHIAGIVNPPVVGKYGYWTHSEQSAEADDWFRGAIRHEGSWWLDWLDWIRPYAGEQVAARTAGGGMLAVLEAAPGSYVKARIGG